MLKTKFIQKLSEQKADKNNSTDNLLMGLKQPILDVVLIVKGMTITQKKYNGKHYLNFRLNYNNISLGLHRSAGEVVSNDFRCNCSLLLLRVRETDTNRQKEGEKHTSTAR